MDQNSSINKKIILAIIAIGAALIAIFARGLYSNPQAQEIETPNTSQVNVISESDPPQVVSTSPGSLDYNTILPSQTVEITFNRPLENVGEFKSRLEPKVEYRVELSSDRKTAKIIPSSTFNLGETYTLIIQPDTKFDGRIELKRDYIFHFKTIGYKGA